MKKLVITALAGALVCVLAACGGLASKNTPTATVEKYSNAIIKGDYKTAIDMIHFEGTDEEIKENKQLMTQMVEEKVKEGLPDEKKMTAVEILGEEINEEDGTAVVKTKVTYANGDVKDETVNLDKVDNKWLVTQKK